MIMEGPKACNETTVHPHHEFGSNRRYFDGEIVMACGEVGIQRAIMAGGSDVGAGGSDDNPMRYGLKRSLQ